MTQSGHPTERSKCPLSDRQDRSNEDGDALPRARQHFTSHTICRDPRGPHRYHSPLSNLDPCPQAHSLTRRIRGPVSLPIWLSRPPSPPCRSGDDDGAGELGDAAPLFAFLNSAPDAKSAPSAMISGFATLPFGTAEPRTSSRVPIAHSSSQAACSGIHLI
jgi:hypothetical protein